MFEKEAEEYVNTHVAPPFSISEQDLYDCFQRASTFGYNKANEWHYPSKGECPDNDSDILCQIDFETFEVGYFHKMKKNFYTIDGKELEVKAWKEIVLPKEIKEND